MSFEFTFQQTPADQQRSQDLSLHHTRPPAEVAGYQIVRFLGSGAYGEVWVGIDRNTGRKVAIKFYRHRGGVDWSLLEREVEKLRFLSADRYVVQLFYVGWDAEPPYYVMEYIEQGSLDDLLRRHGSFSVPEAVELLTEIAVGLSHAHGKGVVHCDLKPANVLLDQDGKPRLADFGQSRLSHEQKPALGTLFYMAPEQADMQAVPDVRWDVYALGAILHTLLTGNPPHRSDDTVAHIDAASELEERLSRYRHTIRAAPPPSEHRRVRGMDRALAEIIERCLAANPDDRFDNVQEVLDALAARKLNRSRLPLMVIGFVGPLLILLVTSFFSFEGYRAAVIDAEHGYGQWALQNNEFASQLAAEKVTGQLSRYFEIARDEAENPDFLQHFFAVINNSPALKKLNDPATPESELAAARAELLEEPQRRHLQDYLQERLNEYQSQAKQDPRMLRFASVFLTDRRGTQLAAAFDDDSVSRLIGQNVAHRPYFHGGDDEREPADRPPGEPPHIERTHLSGVFKSRTQQTWKVGISTPINREAGGEFAGVLVVTVDMGDFNLASAATSRGHEQFVVLVDARKGEDEGTILHHPLFTELVEREHRVPGDLFEPKYHVAHDFLEKQKELKYHDPLADYHDPYGFSAEYRRHWLAAAAPVLPPIGATAHSESGLMVLVQSDYRSVVQPARELGEQFVKNSFWMLIVMVTVLLALWYIVVRMFREQTAGLKRPATPVPESTPIHAMTTVPLGEAPNHKHQIPDKYEAPMKE
jgi:serine/threonine protein kinase